MKKNFLTTGEAARLLGISRATVSRKYDRGILSGYKNPLTGERLISRGSALELLNAAAAASPHGAEPTPFQHVRQWRRSTVGVPVEIEVCPVNSPDCRMPGRAVLENISPGGAYLSRLDLNGGYLPAGPFHVVFKVAQPPLQDWKAEGRVVRLDSRDWLSAAIEFESLSDEDLRIIENLPPSS
jgi:excisionase family DNA binding protein